MSAGKTITYSGRRAVDSYYNVFYSRKLAHSRKDEPFRQKITRNNGTRYCHDVLLSSLSCQVLFHVNRPFFFAVCNYFCINKRLCSICYNLCKSKKREQHPWRSDTFKVCNFSRSNTPPWVFFTFFNCLNGTKSIKPFSGFGFSGFI